MSNSDRGTEFKLNIHLDPIEDYHMSDLDWNVVVSTFSLDGTRQTFEKEQATKVDDDNYTIIVDSASGGAGAYWLTFTAFIPDADAPSGIRKEIVTVFTGVMIDSEK